MDVSAISEGHAQSATQARVNALLSIIWTLAFLFVLSSSASATTFTIAPPPTGNDANDGSEGAPFATLQKAADVAGAGDTINVTPGSYAGAMFTRSGLAGAPIVVHGLDGAAITSPGPLNTNGAGIIVSRVSFVVIEHLEVAALQGGGIVASGPLLDNMSLLEGIVIRGNHVHDTTYGGIAVNNSTGGQIVDNVCESVAGRPGIFVGGVTREMLVARNVVTACQFAGIVFEGFPTLDTPPTYTVVADSNTVLDCGPESVAAIQLRGMRFCLVVNNLLAGNHGRGIDVTMTDGGLMSSANQILNNTVYQAGDGGYPVTIRDGSVSSSVVNNVLLHAGSVGSIAIDSASLVGFVSDYNDIFGPMLVDAIPTSLGEWRASGRDGNSLSAPASTVFIDAAGGNFDIGPSSAVRDAGRVVSGAGHDIRGVARPQGTAFDIGAYEFRVDAPPPDNHDPMAVAGTDVSAGAGERVELDGGGSTDPDQDTLAFAWEQTAGTAVVLDAPAAAAPSFVTPSLATAEDLIFRLTVTDGRGGSSSDSVTVHVAAATPTIEIVRPASGQVWRIGRRKQIKFTVPIGTQGDVRIELSRDGGQSFETIIASVPAARGKTKWRVAGPATIAAIVRVISIQEPGIYGLMAEPFAVE